MNPGGRPLDRSSVAWIVEHVTGSKVSVLGNFDPLMLVSLAKSHVGVELCATASSSAEEAIGHLPASLQEAIAISDFDRVRRADQDSVRTDTVIVQGWPEDCEPAVVLEHINGIAKETGRLIVVLTEFAAERHRELGFDLALFLDALRRHVVPELLSIENEQLRFVGRLGTPIADDWRRFESEIWPNSVGEMVRAIETRHRFELGGLHYRLGRLEQVVASTSFRLGTTLSAAARSPNTIWRLPAQLWRIYRSARPRGRKPRLAGRRLSFPPLQVPAPTATDMPVVAAILDTFSEYCFRYEADLLLLTPGGWRRQMDRAKPAFLLVESAWVGNSGAWRRLIAGNRVPGPNPLEDLLAYCRGHDIPTVFWNKEDPPHFDKFIDAAKGFDVVLTTDADCVPKYKAICGHDRVDVLPFAAQPMLHNPRRESDWPRHRVVFAGSWVSEQYRERTESLRFLLDPALAFGLHIFDRNLSRKDLGSRTSILRFPNRYRSAIKGSLDYAEMLTAYRCYDVLLNTNSVTDSPTMFSRRVFESLACATPVVSTESTGMSELLGKHVRVTRNAEETTSYLRGLLDDDEARVREGHLAYRHVHEHHTYRHRMDDIRRWVGIGPRERHSSPVSVVTVIRRPDRAMHAIDSFARQTYPDKELVLLLDGVSSNIDAIDARVRDPGNVRVAQMAEGSTLPACFNRGVEEASGEYVMMMDDDCFYGERYVADTMLSAGFAGTEILGKGTYFLYDENSDTMTLKPARPEHQLTDFVVGSTLAAHRDLLLRTRFPERGNDSRSAFLDEALRAGCRAYSTDRFNHVAVGGALRQTAHGELPGSTDDRPQLRSGLDLSRAIF